MNKNERIYKRLTNIFQGKNYSKREELEDMLCDMLDFVESCENEVKASKIELIRDSEIQQLNKRIELLLNENALLRKQKGLIFSVTEEELQAIKEWKSKHIKEKHNNNNYSGLIGGRFSYEFTPTSIGEVGEITCTCGEKFCFKEIK